MLIWESHDLHGVCTPDFGGFGNQSPAIDLELRLLTLKGHEKQHDMRTAAFSCGMNSLGLKFAYLCCIGKWKNACSSLFVMNLQLKQAESQGSSYQVKYSQ